MQNASGRFRLRILEQMALFPIYIDDEICFENDAHKWRVVEINNKFVLLQSEESSMAISRQMLAARMKMGTAVIVLN